MPTGRPRAGVGFTCGGQWGACRSELRSNFICCAVRAACATTKHPTHRLSLCVADRPRRRCARRRREREPRPAEAWRRHRSGGTGAAPLLLAAPVVTSTSGQLATAIRSSAGRRGGRARGARAAASQGVAAVQERWRCGSGVDRRSDVLNVLI